MLLAAGLETATMVPDSTSLQTIMLVVGVLLLGTAALGTGVAAGQSDSVSLVTMNETVRVHSVEDATIHGTSDLEAGTNLSIRLKSTGETSPRFFKTTTASVQSDGDFVVTFDLSELETGDTFSVTVQQGNQTVASAEGKVVAQDVAVTPTATPSPTPSPSPTETTGPGLGVLSAILALAAGVALLRS